jgi:hypothetical protein
MGEVQVEAAVWFSCLIVCRSRAPYWSRCVITGNAPSLGQVPPPPLTIGVTPPTSMSEPNEGCFMVSLEIGAQERTPEVLSAKVLSCHLVQCC